MFGLINLETLTVVAYSFRDLRVSPYQFSDPICPALFH